MTTETLTQPTTEYGADALIVCDNLVRIYQVENIEVQALQGLDLLVDKGEMIAIVGQSGSGKSTLLNVLSGLDVPTAGSARVAGWDLLRMTHADRLTYRRSVVGFVWQQTGRNLLSYLNAKENVMLPMAFAGISGKRRADRAMELLSAMGMADKAGRRPGQLSGGEQQRIAIAVALANTPEVIFADEPTGELDSATGDDVFEALRAANRDLGATVVVVTHDHAVSSQVQRTVAIRDGRTATEVVRRTHVDSEGVTQTVHEEYAVLDRAGRMQLPRDYRTSLKLKDRVRLELENDHIGIWPDGSVKKVRHEPPAVVEESTAVAEGTVVEEGTVVAESTVVEESTAVAEAAVVAKVAEVAEVVEVPEIPEEAAPSAAASPYLAPQSPYLAPQRPVVETPSKPPAPVTGAVPVVAAEEISAAEVSADAISAAESPLTETPAEAAPVAEETPAQPEYRPSPYANLSAYEPHVDALADPEPYTPLVPAPPAPAAPPQGEADPYAPPPEMTELPRAPWLPKENDDD